MSRTEALAAVIAQVRNSSRQALQAIERHVTGWEKLISDGMTINKEHINFTDFSEQFPDVAESLQRKTKAFRELLTVEGVPNTNGPPNPLAKAIPSGSTALIERVLMGGPNEAPFEGVRITQVDPTPATQTESTSTAKPKK